MENNFHIVVEDTLDVANYLIKKEYEELDNSILEDIEDEPIKIIIDQDKRTFWFADSLAIVKAEEMIEQKIKPITLKEVKKWEF